MSYTVGRNKCAINYRYYIFVSYGEYCFRGDNINSMLKMDIKSSETKRYILFLIMNGTLTISNIKYEAGRVLCKIRILLGNCSVIITE